MPTVDCEAPNWEAALLIRTDELYVEEDERLRLMHEQIEAHRREFSSRRPWGTFKPA